MQRIGLWSVLVVAIVACFVVQQRAWAAAGDTLSAGAVAPNFTLPSQDNQPVSLASYKGKWVVLYFYPKDKTTGCTIEAHNFQRDLSKYAERNAVILGVSLDTADSHKSFCTQESLTFKLLADPAHKVVDAYGVPVMTRGDMGYAKRITYLISPEGKVTKVWNVTNVNDHSADVLVALDELRK